MLSSGAYRAAHRRRRGSHLEGHRLHRPQHLRARSATAPDASILEPGEAADRRRAFFPLAKGDPDSGALSSIRYVHMDGQKVYQFAVYARHRDRHHGRR
ncbi:MAG: hypothetical protein MZU97_05140 [Bacillus subtilis]|nr:hypothetical protein [Bacillus subtilis]